MATMQRRIVTLVVLTSLALVGAGCAAQSTGMSGADGAAAPSPIPSELTGTWRGRFNNVAGDSTDRQGDLVLEIKDDASYRLSWTRKGATSNESGVILATGSGAVTLRSSSGHSLTLKRRGNALYGMSTYPGGHAVSVSIEKAEGIQKP